jgi:hypothetical protein
VKQRLNCLNYETKELIKETAIFMKQFLLFIIFICLIFSNNYSQSLVINEFEALNTSTLKDNNGDYDDWIEIANLSSQSINLNGYYITDDLNVKTKCKLNAVGNELTVEAGGFIILWADNELAEGSNHLNFKLSGDGEQIGLLSPGLQILDSVTFKKQNADVSQGRDLNNITLWKYFKTPTPGKINNSHAFNGVSGTPAFSILSGCYDVSQSVSISSSELNDTIRYTLNNSDPKVNSLIYQAAIPVTKTGIIRAITDNGNNINSNIVSQIYILNSHPKLPVLAIITDSANLYGTKGIYTNHDSAGNNWERSCQLKYIADGTLKAEANAGIRIQGGSSVFMSKKSFRLFFSDAYGTGKFNYPVFGNNNLQQFDKLVLKAGYDDDITFESTRTGTLLRDALSVELWKKIGGLPQLSSWAVLYLNSNYWGIYDIRESIEEQFIKDHTGLTDFDLVRFHNEGVELKHGALARWNNLFNLINTSDFSKAENYHAVEAMMDMDNFITLMAFAQCAQYYSWCYGVSMYLPTNPIGKWKFSIWDTDRAYTELNWDGFDEAQRRTDTYFWGNIFPKQLIKSPIFKQKYADKIDLLLRTVFKPENAIPILDSLYSIIKPEMPAELEKWNPSNATWESNVEAVREFFRNRPAILREQMKSYLPEPSSINSVRIEKCKMVIYPNPFSIQSNIIFNLEHKCIVEISVYSLDGREIINLYKGIADQGEHKITWNGKGSGNSNIHTGLYLIRFKTSEKMIYSKVILLN